MTYLRPYDVNMFTHVHVVLINCKHFDPKLKGQGHIGDLY